MADGFYEWHKTGNNLKIPYYFKLKSGEPFAFAGLWDLWEKNGNDINTFTIITTSPNKLMEPIHNRMPVILNEADEGKWLDPEIIDPQYVLPLLKPYPSEKMECFEVGGELPWQVKALLLATSLPESQYCGRFPAF